ncbi:glycoside hydrolase family 76 protein [Brachybacterium hainanense]|uniref:Glycoside hydrolase family 76 protein n=1 Tax=Brachybacterium hainanense TaxID=1541174 RepID=A0ABV6RD65_9MICO
MSPSSPAPRSPSPALSRRAALGAAGTIGALAATGPLSSAQAEPGSGPGHGEARDRARAALEALQRHFAIDDGSDLLLEHAPRREDDPPSSYEWPLSQARAATAELSHAPGVTDLAPMLASRDRAQERYWHAAGGDTGLPGYASATDPATGAHGDYFYDDNAWVGMLEVEEHLLTDGRRGDVARAEEVMALLRSGWDDDPTHPAPGGVWWAQTDWNDDRNTVSNMPTAKLGIRLFQLTGAQEHLDLALRCVDWTREHLLADNGLFWDNVKLDGSIDRTQWTYNQGVPLGVEALLFEVTGDSTHRDRCLAIVEALIGHYDVWTEGGSLDAQPVAFNAILASNLLLAESVLGPEVPGRRLVAAMADRQWRLLRDPETDLFRRGADAEGTELLDQAGFARTQALAALPRPLWRHLT